jgi:gamma-glutamyltranspeptidase/glutathione hydrolase
MTTRWPLVGRGDRIVGAPFASRGAVMARNGAAATSHPLATQTAIDILKSGGSAMDAAIAANLVLGVVEPTGAGPGGDLFALVWEPGDDAPHAYNGSGRSPRALTYETAKSRVQANGYLPRVGAVSVSTPGAVDGWFALHARFGRAPIADLFAPAIACAREGFVVTPLIATYWRTFLKSVITSGVVEETANAFATFGAGGLGPAAGDVWCNPDLAATYECLASGGRDEFYNGGIARTIANYMGRIGGWLGAEDLAGHVGDWVEPLSTAYRGYDVWQIGGNTQGVAVLEMLNLMERFHLVSMGAGSADAIHVMIEAKKIAFADRARHLGDPAFAPSRDRTLMSKTYAEGRAAEIRTDHAALAVEAGAPPARADTVYLTTADRDGMMVSLIQSNYFMMGSGLVPDGLGFMLQNRGAMFSFEDGHANRYAPGKRPMHTIIPGFASRQGEPWLSFGVMGGAMQAQGQVQILSNLIDFGMGVQEAGDAARWQHYGSGTADDPALPFGGEVTLESGFDPAVIETLRARGHTIAPSRPLSGYGGYQAILRDPATLAYHAATEMRFDGAAGGY